jgi:uncharacterized repeat protein (TIGR01451 family)
VLFKEILIPKSMNLLSIYLKKQTLLKDVFHTRKNNFNHAAYHLLDLRMAFITVVSVVFLSFQSFAAQVDLSLKQQVDKAAPQLNEIVKFTVYIKNSGPATATNIVVEDKVPINGINTISSSINGGTWAYDALSGTGTWTIPSLASGDSLRLEISGTVTQRGVFFNIAEVKTSPDTDPDSSPGNSSMTEDDITTACFTVPLLWFAGDQYTVAIPAIYRDSLNVTWYYNGVEITALTTQATVNPNKSLTIKAPGSYTFTTPQTTCGPTGCCPVVVTQGQVFDLALQKTSYATYVMPDSSVRFDVNIYNQGEITATSIQVADYIPAGLVLNDSNWEELTPGIATLKVPVDTLKAGHTVQKRITFKASPSATGTLMNVAEISSARDGQGNIVEDIDSTPDSNPSNDGTAKNDVITENHKKNASDDEDDSDFCTVTVSPGPVFDLAMRKILLTEGPLFPGSKVTFEFYAINQGTLNATSVKLVDYIPAGLILEDTSWTQSGNIATLNNPSLHIIAGRITCPKITFRIDPAFTGSQIINKGEISQAKGPLGEDVTDIDSSPDSDPLNDIVAIDDEVLQNGKTGGDEDDADFTTIFVNQYTRIGDLVWNDKNYNGIQDPLEPGIPGVTVRLETISGDTLRTTVTNASGIYHFDSLMTGNYVVAFQKPAGYLGSPKSVGDPAKDSDVDPLTGKSGSIALVSGVSNLNIDAGIYLLPCDEITSVTALNDQLCVGDSTYIKAVSSLGGRISYYIVPSGGSPVFTGASGENKLIFPTTSTVYYAVSDSVNFGCTNARVPVAVTVHARPSNPTSISNIEVCPGSKINLTAQIINGITTPGGVFEWRVGASPSSALVATPTAVGPGNYYLFEKSGAGCYSNPTLLRVVEKTCNEIIDLSLLKTADKRIVALNDTITYTILLSNAGPDSATNIVIEDVLPAGLLFVSSPEFVNTSGRLTLNLPKLLAGQSKTFTYKTKVTRTGTIINIAEVKSVDQFDSDSTPGNGSTINEDDDDDEIIQVNSTVQSADLSLKKIVSNNTPNVNSNVTYFITVKNSGPDKATNVQVKDILPAGLQLVSTTGADLITSSLNTVTAQFDTILVNEEVEFSIVAKVLNTGPITNRAEVMTSDQPDPDSTPGTGADEDDDDTSTINPIQPCNPTTPIIATLNSFICLGESATLTAIGCNGTITWSTGQTGNSISVSPLTNTTYTAKCTVGACISPNSNSVNIVVNTIAPPLITASATSVCTGTAVTLTATGCTGTVRWSNNVLGASIQVAITQNTTFTAVCTVNTCVSNASAPVSITTTPSVSAPVITANKTSICVGDSVTLSATNCTLAITWSTGQTGSTITVKPVVNTNYTATCGSGACVSPNSNTIAISVGSGQGTPNIVASVNATCGGQAVTLTAENCTSGISWSTGQTASSITVTPNATTTYTLTCGSGACTKTATKTITVGGLGQTPVIQVSNASICRGANATLTASNCTGSITWSNGGTGNSITVSPDSTRSYTATCSTGTSCQGYATATITVTPKPQAPIVTAGKDTVCVKESVTLTASNCTGTVTWSNGAAGTTTVVNPEVNSTYTATCTVNGCPSVNSLPVSIITRGIAPVIVASKESICDTSSVTLTVSNCTGALLWSTGASTASIKVKPSATTTYTATCSVSGCVGTASKQIKVGSATPPVVTASLANACPALSVSLLTAVTSPVSAGGKFLYRTGNSPTSPAVANPALVTATGAYYVFDSTASGCISTGARINVTISNCGTPPNCVTSPATAFAGVDSTVCLTGVSTFALNGVIGGAATSGTWTTSNGTGTFDSNTKLNAKYKYSSQDITRGNVVFILTTNDPDGAGTCVAARDTMKLTINGIAQKPAITLSKPAALCFGDSLTLTASDAPGLKFLWSTGDTTKTIKVKVAGNYWVKLRNNTSCTSVNSDTTAITVKPSITAPTVTPLASNVCPVNKVDLSTKILSLPSTPGGIFEFHTGISPASPLVANPTAVGAGSYIIFEKSTAGCYSQPALINVTITPCAGELCIATSLKADTIRQVNGSYNVKFRSLVQNCGSDTLRSVSLTHVLDTVFVTPSVFTFVQKPVVNAGSKLVANNNFNGDTNILLLNPATSKLDPGKTDTITYIINLIPNGETGPFYTNTKAVGKVSVADSVSDISNDGLVIVKANSDPTIIRLKNTVSIGLAKAIIDTVKNNDGSYDVKYKLIVKNNGLVNLDSVVVSDSLAKAFKAPATYTMVGKPIVNTTSSLVTNNLFDGAASFVIAKGPLAVGKADTIWFTVKVRPDTVTRFENQALAKSTGSKAAQELSNDGTNPDAPGNAPTVLLIDDSVLNPGACIGLALYVADTTKQINGMVVSYNVTYHAIVKNCGTIPLKNISICDTLANTFGNLSVAVVGQPSLGIGSTLTIDPTFSGKNNNYCLLNPALSTLAPGKTDTLKWTINVILNGNNGPFLNNVTGFADTPENDEIFDVSNDGTNPDPDGSDPTILNFNDLPKQLIGIAKKLYSGVPVDNKPKSFDLVFKFRVKNYGVVDFDKVQVQDNLAATFGDNVIIDSVKVFDVTNGFVANPLYTGKGDLINLLNDSLGPKLASKAEFTFSLFARVDLSFADTSKFDNWGFAIGYYPDSSTDDLSTDGDNPDKDLNGTPSNDSDPTVIDFGDVVNPPVLTPLGIAKAVSDTVKNSDGSYALTYTVIVKNYGTSRLDSVQLVDSLNIVFENQTIFALIDSVTLNPGSQLVLNPYFANKDSMDFRLLIADSSSLAAGASDTLTFRIKVRNNATESQTYFNTVVGTALDSTVLVSDISHSGFDPDENGNNNPGDDNNPTEIMLEPAGADTSTVLLFISEGLTPNNDGLNEKLIIKDLNVPNGLTASDSISVIIYNRWGQMVFKSENYKLDYPDDDNGWDGVVNQGIKIGRREAVPDGTYYYVMQSPNVRVFGGKRYVNFITIAR